MNIETQSTADITTKDFVKLVLGKSRILLPATELLSIEPGNMVDLRNKDNKYEGHITLNNIDIPVYALDDELRLLAVADLDWQTCVCLTDNHNCIGILCNDADTISLDNIKIYQLPACMHVDDSPIIAVVENNHNLYCLSQTINLIGLIKNCQGN